MCSNSIGSTTSNSGRSSRNPMQPPASRALLLTQHERPHNHAACKCSVAATAVVVRGWAQMGRAAADAQLGKAPDNRTTPTQLTRSCSTQQAHHDKPSPPTRAVRTTNAQHAGDGAAS